MHTHYDNLKVAKNAPFEVIRAAYRVLAQRYHPDLNRSPDAARVMKLLNEAYAVLSDQQRRAAHDAWIEEHLIKEALDEAMAGNGHEHGAPETPSHQARDADDLEAPSERSRPSASVRLNRWLGTAAGAKFGVGAIAGACFVAWLWLVKTPANVPSAASQIAAPSPLSSAMSQAEQSRKAPSYIPFNGALDPQSGPRPSAAAFPNGKPAPRTFSYEEAIRPASQSQTAAVDTSKAAPAWSPNGKPWPTRSAYLDGFPRRASSGLSTLTIDNTNGGASVYVKLCRASMDRCDGLRHVFIPLGASFTMSSVSPGAYDIRYRALDTGALSKSEVVNLAQVETERGTRYTTMRLTLYRVAGGNTSFESLPEDKF
jgi:DnaJ domain